MVKLKENIECWSEPFQRDLLLRLLDNETIKSDFFLTGGTALSVFYLHHRTSIDLDLFTLKESSMDEIHLWIAKSWPKENRKINQNEFILQMLIKNIKVDIVYDPLSFDEPREKYYFDKNKFITIDSLTSIVSNKLATLVSRREIKDFIDFFFINKKIEGLDLDTIYKGAQKKEGMFDDSPTVAYQLENNFNIIKQNPYAFPEISCDFDMDEFNGFYETLIDKIYHRKKPLRSRR